MVLTGPINCSEPLTLERTFSLFRERNTLEPQTLLEHVCLFESMGNPSGQAVSSDKTDFGGFSFQAARKLNATDRVDLFMHFGKAYSVYFSGWLMDEDLII